MNFKDIFKKYGINQADLKIKVDSFSILLPEALFYEVPYEVNTLILMTQGDVLLETKQPMYTLNSKGIKLKVSRKRIPKKNSSYFHFVLTAKMLKGNYFEGINIINITCILSFLDALGFKSSVSDLNILRESYIYDMDLCTDISLGINDFHDFCRDVGKSTTDNQRLKFYDKRVFENFKDLGKKTETLQINTRKIASYNYPFIKFYSKSTELLTNSPIFTSSFLDKNFFVKNRDLRRIEITLKNSKFLKKYDNNITFLDLLSSEKLRENLFFSIINVPLLKNSKFIMRSTSDNNLYKALYISLINSLYQPNKSKKENIADILRYILHYYDADRFQKSKLKKKITELINDNIEKNDGNKRNNTNRANELY